MGCGLKFSISQPATLNPQRSKALSGLSVDGVFAAMLAILAQFKPLLGSARFSFFGCRVVSRLALGALQLDNNSHDRSTSCRDLSSWKPTKQRTKILAHLLDCKHPYSCRSYAVEVRLSLPSQFHAL